MMHLRLPLLSASMALLMAHGQLHAQVAISPTSGATPSPNAMLEVISTNKGFLAPRVTATQRTSMGAVAGLIVYQTDGTAGYYYYYDTAWRMISASRTWSLGGDAINPATDFLGTTNAQPLAFRTQSLERMRIAATGEVLVHAGTAPAVSERMHVQGAVKIGTTAGTSAGAMRFDNGQFQGYLDNSAPDNGWQQMDNVFGTRKGQLYTPISVLPCNTPSDVANPQAAPRSWPIIGPGAGSLSTDFGSMSLSPYGSIWEDGRRQYLYKSDSLAAKGICGPIKAVAFYVPSTFNTAAATYHFVRISLKNTTEATMAAGIDPTGLTVAHSSGDCPSTWDLVVPTPPPTQPPYVRHQIPAPRSPIYHDAGSCGYWTTPVPGWKVHNFNALGNDPIAADASGFNWAGIGYNLLVDASMDNQHWGVVASAPIQVYSAGYTSTAFVYCDACGHTTPGGALCGWSGLPPAVPQTGTQAAQYLYEGWGWVGGWDLNNGTSLRECSGDATPWVGSRGTMTSIPRIAFYANYTGGNLPTARADYLFSQQGVMIGDATWAAGAHGSAPHRMFKGPGTISAQKSVWGGGVLLSDHVFDHHYDGTIRPEDAVQARGYEQMSISAMADHLEQQRHLPTIDGRAEWNASGPFSLDKLTTQLWVSVEQQALYIKELNERMEALQQYLVEKRLNELKQAPAPVKKK